MRGWPGQSLNMAKCFSRQGLPSAVQHSRTSVALVVLLESKLWPNAFPEVGLHMRDNAGPGTQKWLTRKPASSFGAVYGLPFRGRKLVWAGNQELQSAAICGDQPRLQAKVYLRRAEVRSALQPVLQTGPWLPVKDRDGHPAPACRTRCALRLTAACRKPPTSPSWHLPSSTRASVLLGSQLQHSAPAHHELFRQYKRPRLPAAGSACGVLI